jgi:hypothetical protein
MTGGIVGILEMARTGQADTGPVLQNTQVLPDFFFVSKLLPYL